MADETVVLEPSGITPAPEVLNRQNSENPSDSSDGSFSLMPPTPSVDPADLPLPVVDHVEDAPVRPLITYTDTIYRHLLWISRRRNPCTWAFRYCRVQPVFAGCSGYTVCRVARSVPVNAYVPLINLVHCQGFFLY
jgi:hypothetical protein